MVPEGEPDNKKSILDWIRYTVAIAFLLPCFLVVVIFLKYEGTWSMWLSLFLSRSIYIILATLIFGCFIINFFKNKVQGDRRADNRTEESWCAPQDIWKLPNLASCGELTAFGRKTFQMEDCESDAVKQMLREADTRNEALKRELEELNKTRLALEERSGALEREKARVEESLEETKYHSALESERLRKEAVITERQLQQVLEEREMLAREVSSVSREARITESALKDQARLTTRLEEARSELNRLKLQMEELKMERDTAMAIAADLAVRAQGVADDSAQLIGQWVRREMENRRKTNKPSANAVEDVELETEEVPEIKDIEQENKQNEKIELFQGPPGNAFEAGDNQGFLNSMQDEMNRPKVDLNRNAEGGAMINRAKEDPDDCLQAIGCGPVTSSAAFRDFLSSHYSHMPL